MRRLLYAASVLVFLAGFQLFILTEQTDKYFAWTISPPFITAAFLGAAYWSSVPLELIAIIRYPGDVNWSLPAAWIYLTFLITILPLGLYCWFAKHRLSSKIS